MCEAGYSGRITAPSDVCHKLGPPLPEPEPAPAPQPQPQPRPEAPRSAGVSDGWRLACAIVTACGSASLVYVVPYFRRTLRSLRRLKLPEDDREQGVGGLLLFVCGIVDLLLSLRTCWGLFACDGVRDSYVLALCFLAALTVNYATTAGLALHTLDRIREDSAHDHGTEAPLLRDATRLLVEHVLKVRCCQRREATSSTNSALRHPKLLPMLVAGSIPRIQSLAMLRSKIRGHEVMEYPMDDKHMFFLRNAVRLSPGCLR